MDFDEMLRVDRFGTWTNWLTFEPDPDYSPDAITGLLSPISYALQRGILLRRGNPTYLAPVAAATRGLKWFHSPRAMRTTLAEVHALHRSSALLVCIALHLAVSSPSRLVLSHNHTSRTLHTKNVWNVVNVLVIGDDSYSFSHELSFYRAWWRFCVWWEQEVIDDRWRTFIDGRQLRTTRSRRDVLEEIRQSK